MRVVIFAVDTAEAEALAARFQGQPVYLPNASNIGSAVFAFARQERGVLICAGRGLSTGWRAPPGALILVTPRAAIASTTAEMLQADARVTPEGYKS